MALSSLLATLLLPFTSHFGELPNILLTYSLILDPDQRAPTGFGSELCEDIMWNLQKEPGWKGLQEDTENLNGNASEAFTHFPNRLSVNGTNYRYRMSDLLWTTHRALFIINDKLKIEYPPTSISEIKLLKGLNNLHQFIQWDAFFKSMTPFPLSQPHFSALQLFARDLKLKLQSTLDISNSDNSNSAKFEASIWINNTFWLLSPTIIWRWRLFYKSKLPEVQINLHFG